MSIQLTFSGDCWTEIKDANGRALFVDLAKGGSTRTVSGAPPIRVLLGDSQNVRIKVNGTDYQVPEQSRSGLTARFTIEKQ
jgi:cytoskeleton protein RodZ